MKKYTLRRIIDQRACPGTCCKMSGTFPESGTNRCIYFDDEIPGRLYGGCPFFLPDNEINVEEYLILSSGDQTKFSNVCKDWPTPVYIPQLDTEYDTHFGRDFAPICECFQWEVTDDGSGNSPS